GVSNGCNELGICKSLPVHPPKRRHFAIFEGCGMKTTHSPAIDGSRIGAESDVQLVERARRGDERAFRSIMERHNRRLYRVARTVLRDDAEAEDAVQEAYLRAFAGLAGFRGEASLATWLTRITLNEALRRKRKHKPTTELSAANADRQTGAEVILFPNMKRTDPERGVAKSKIRKLLEWAIDGLPEAFRTVFVLRDVEKMSIEEPAAFLGIPPQPEKPRLHRARRLLRESLDG